MSEKHNRPVVVIACAVFQHLIEKLLPADLASQTTFLDYGLHVVPARLTEAVQEKIDEVAEPSTIVLGYGLCGNGLDGIRARDHVLIVPRADDCIAILLGSNEAYRREFDAQPGTYYLSKGWLEAGSDPLREYERYQEQYGAETAAWIMDQQYRHYKRLVLVAHTPEDLAKYRGRAKEVAEYCARWGMRYEEILGSDEYLRRLVQAITTLTRSNGDFLVIPPGQVIDRLQFVRSSSSILKSSEG